MEPAKISCSVKGCTSTITPTVPVDVDDECKKAGWIKDGYHAFTCPKCLSLGVVAAFNGDLYKWPITPDHQKAENPHKVKSRPQGPMEF